MAPELNSSTQKVGVATTVALSFISFWRAAAVVLSDLASSAFYAGGIADPVGPNRVSAVVGVLVTLYFWWNNIKGIHESSGKALRVMQITAVMVVAFLIWCPITILLRGNVSFPPAPLPRNLHSSPDAL